MKTVFLFHVKSFYRSGDFHIFCPEYLVMYKNGLIRKLRLISKFITSQNGQQIRAIHTFPNILRSKGNHKQTMKFGHLLEPSVRNIFLEKSYTKSNGENSPRPFYKKSKLSISLDQQSEIL